MKMEKIWGGRGISGYFSLSSAHSVVRFVRVLLLMGNEAVL